MIIQKFVLEHFGNLPTADYLCGMCDLEKGFVDICDAVIPCTAQKNKYFQRENVIKIIHELYVNILNMI